MLPIVKVLAVPQFAVVMFALPSNEVPFIVLAVANFVAVAEFPVQANAVVADPPAEDDPA